jgi:hypothetical protein
MLARYKHSSLLGSFVSYKSGAVFTVLFVLLTKEKKATAFVLETVQAYSNIVK